MFTQQLPPFLSFADAPAEPGTNASDLPPAPAPSAIRTNEQPAEPQAPPANPAFEAAAAQPAGDTTPPWGDNFDPERAWTLIQKLRGDNAAIKERRDADIAEARTVAEREAIERAYAEMGKTLGVVEPDAPTPSAETLAAALSEKDASLSDTQAALAATRAENAVLRYAGKHGGDADALLDSRDFERKLTSIDSNADDYASQVEALVKAEVEKNGRYRKAQVAPSSSSGEATPGGGAPSAPKSIDELREERRKRRGA